MTPPPSPRWCSPADRNLTEAYWHLVSYRMCPVTSLFERRTSSGALPCPSVPFSTEHECYLFLRAGECGMVWAGSGYGLVAGCSNLVVEGGRHFVQSLSNSQLIMPHCSIELDQRFSNCGPRTTSGRRVLPLWSF